MAAMALSTDMIQKLCTYRCFWHCCFWWKLL